ncbi:hypothetical protein OHC33_002584 [Knufia fluminis]|uniref:Uncharacterized protein n=1 Tax=Knufia fluminis TaxID=191047 RepID=A0AAN8EXR6_9EURO|nr:hypothetical protein OHC33_002584 [Knufia fluminis]
MDSAVLSHLVSSSDEHIPGFLRLPSEIRHQIYEDLFSHETLFITEIKSDQSGTRAFRPLPEEEHLDRFWPHPLCYVNKQIAHEANIILYHRATFTFKVGVPRNASPPVTNVVFSRLTNLSMHFQSFHKSFAKQISLPWINKVSKETAPVSAICVPSLPQLKNLDLRYQPRMSSRGIRYVGGPYTLLICRLLWFRKTFNLTATVEARFPYRNLTGPSRGTGATTYDPRLTLFARVTARGVMFDDSEWSHRQASKPRWEADTRNALGFTNGGDVLAWLVYHTYHSPTMAMRRGAVSSLSRDDFDKVQQVIAVERKDEFEKAWGITFDRIDQGLYP